MTNEQNIKYVFLITAEQLTNTKHVPFFLDYILKNTTRYDVNSGYFMHTDQKNYNKYNTTSCANILELEILQRRQELEAAIESYQMGISSFEIFYRHIRKLFVGISDDIITFQNEWNKPVLISPSWLKELTKLSSTLYNSQSILIVIAETNPSHYASITGQLNQNRLSNLCNYWSRSDLLESLNSTRLLNNAISLAKMQCPSEPVDLRNECFNINTINTYIQKFDKTFKNETEKVNTKIQNRALTWLLNTSYTQLKTLPPEIENKNCKLKYKKCLLL